jgi:hypothetical protein
MGIYELKQKEITEIRKYAIKLFLDKGLRNTTLKDIIAEVSLDKREFVLFSYNSRDVYFLILENKLDSFILCEISLIKDYLREMSNTFLLSKLSRFLSRSLFFEFAERELFLLGINESFYDENFRQDFLDFEKKYIDIITNAILNTVNEQDRVINEFKKNDIVDKINFFYNIYCSFMIKCNSPVNKDFYYKKRGSLEKIFYELLIDFQAVFRENFQVKCL